MVAWNRVSIHFVCFLAFLSSAVLGLRNSAEQQDVAAATLQNAVPSAFGAVWDTLSLTMGALLDAVPPQSSLGEPLWRARAADLAAALAQELWEPYVALANEAGRAAAAAGEVVRRRSTAAADSVWGAYVAAYGASDPAAAAPAAIELWTWAVAKNVSPLDYLLPPSWQPPSFLAAPPAELVFDVDGSLVLEGMPSPLLSLAVASPRPVSQSQG